MTSLATDYSRSELRAWAMAHRELGVNGNSKNADILKAMRAFENAPKTPPQTKRSGDDASPNGIAELHRGDSSQIIFSEKLNRRELQKWAMDHPELGINGNSPSKLIHVTMSNFNAQNDIHNVNQMKREELQKWAMDHRNLGINGNSTNQAILDAMCRYEVGNYEDRVTQMSLPNDKRSLRYRTDGSGKNGRWITKDCIDYLEKYDISFHSGETTKILKEKVEAHMCSHGESRPNRKRSSYIDFSGRKGSYILKYLTQLPDGDSCLLMVHADWCGACERAMPYFRQCAEQSNDDSEHFVLIDENTEDEFGDEWYKYTLDKFGDSWDDYELEVGNYPSFIVFKKRKGTLHSETLKPTTWLDILNYMNVPDPFDNVAESYEFIACDEKIERAQPHRKIVLENTKNRDLYTGKRNVDCLDPDKADDWQCDHIIECQVWQAVWCSINHDQNNVHLFSVVQKLANGLHNANVTEEPLNQAKGYAFREFFSRMRKLGIRLGEDPFRNQSDGISSFREFLTSIDYCNSPQRGKLASGDMIDNGSWIKILECVDGVAGDMKRELDKLLYQGQIQLTRKDDDMMSNYLSSLRNMSIQFTRNDIY